MKRALPLVLLLLLAALLYWRWQASSARPGLRREQSSSSDGVGVSRREGTSPAPAAIPYAAAGPTDPAASPAARASQPLSNTASVAAEVAPLPPELAALPPATVLENMRSAIRNYGATFGGNPVGTNPEITKALQGDNPRHITFLKEDGNRVNANGELVDLWGTPYFFHQLSGTEMEIRSAGPDRRMWTGDDLVTK